MKVSDQFESILALLERDQKFVQDNERSRRDGVVCAVHLNETIFSQTSFSFRIKLQYFFFNQSFKFVAAILLATLHSKFSDILDMDIQKSITVCRFGLV